MRRSAGKIFISGFVKSIFIVAILLSAGIIGYKATIHFLKPPQDEAVVAYKEEPVQENITEATVDYISKNLIYCYDEDTKEINKIVLEIFHCKNKKLTYITIPLRTQLTMSDTLYRKLVLLNPEIPQMMKLSSVTKYLDSATVFDYGVLIMEDMLGIDISYYTVIPQKLYNTMFTEKYIASEAADVPMEVFQDDYVDYLKTLETKKKISDYMNEIYPSLRSNLEIYDKMNYLDSYSETPIDNISFELMKGSNLNSAYEINTELLARQLGDLLQE